MTSRAPARDVAHYDDPIDHAGGILGDSYAGSIKAKRAKKKWVDNDGHLTSDLRWVRAHGAPYNPDGLPPGSKFEDHTAQWLHDHIPGLNSAFEAFHQNAKLGLNTEWEVKDLHPLVTDSDLTRAFARLRFSARKAYGADWQDRAQVKVLTNLRGGLPYARKICSYAHRFGFDTIILPRGIHRLQKISGPAITFNRGGRV